MQQTQNAEGTASGTTVTLANSATGGDAYTTVNIGTGAAFTFDNTHAAHGVNGYRISIGATSTNANGLQTFTGVATVFGRFYIYVPTSTGFGYTNFGVRMRSAGAQSGRICFDATGHMIIKDNGNSPVGSAGSVALSLDTWYRVEFTMTRGASSTASCDLYLLDSVSSLDTVSVAAQNFGTGTIDEMGIGAFTATTNQGPWWWDDTVVNDTGRPGPVVTPSTFLAKPPTQARQAVNRAASY
jgi:hypothetical protein